MAKVPRTPSAKPRVPMPSNTDGGNYFVQVWEELKKVIWPTRNELVRMTGIVIATVLIFSAIIGVTDYVLALGAQQVYKTATATPTPASATSSGASPTAKPRSSPTPTAKK